MRQNEKGVSYEELSPDPLLRNFIYCYWQLKTDHPLEDEYTYRVVADGCMDIFFDLNDPSESFVMGFCSEFTEFPLKRNFNYVGIRFFPSIFPQLFHVSARELSNSSYELETVLSATASFIKDRFDPTLSFPHIATKFNEYFLSYIKNTTFDLDPRFYNAVHLILQKHGILQVENHINTGITSRQLRRIFDHFIGTTPKTFSKVVRFQGIVKAKSYFVHQDQNKLFYDYGYYDQAHFIKEFKMFFGETPSKAFR